MNKPIDIKNIIGLTLRVVQESKDDLIDEYTNGNKMKTVNKVYDEIKEEISYLLKQ